MWLYPGPSSLDCSFSEELSATEINTWIHKVLDHGANLNPWTGPTPLREGVANTWVSLFGSVSAAYAILSFHRARCLMQGLEGACSMPQGDEDITISDTTIPSIELQRPIMRS
jgi:hypothetical protein